MLPSIPVLAAALLPGFAFFGGGAGGGTVLTGTFPGSQRPGYVYLPPGFALTQRYPVVYLLHGMRGSPSEYLAGTRLQEFADRGIADGTIRPFVAVIPAAGPDRSYNGEWAGEWETMVVHRIVPWIDRYLPTIRGPTGRTIAGLSAGGYGAAEIGLRNLGFFGTIEGWGGYYHPLHDGPFRHADAKILRANDPFRIARLEGPLLRRDGVAFFLSTGPGHSHWFTPAQTFAFARELRGLGLRVATYWHPEAQGQWQAQLDAGLTWALATGRGARASSRSGAISATPSP